MFVGAHGFRKRVSGPLELEGQANVNYWSQLLDMGAGNSATAHVLFATRDNGGT